MAHIAPHRSHFITPNKYSMASLEKSFETVVESPSSTNVPGSHTRWLFISAACFNWIVGLSGLLMMHPVASMLALQLDSPTAILFFQITMGCVTLLGWAYYMIAVDPERYRPFLVLGILGKSMFMIIIYGHGLAGDMSWQLPALVTFDLMYTVLFIRYLHRTTAS